jgi:hypothetical protein
LVEALFAVILMQNDKIPPVRLAQLGAFGTPAEITELAFF